MVFKGVLLALLPCLAMGRSMHDDHHLYLDQFKISEKEFRNAEIYDQEYKNMFEKFYPRDEKRRDGGGGGDGADETVNLVRLKRESKKEDKKNHHPDSGPQPTTKKKSFLESVKGFFGLGGDGKKKKEEGGGKGKETRASCKFDGSAQGEVEGTLDLFEKNGELHISGTVEGVGKKHKKHGFHVHEKGDIGENCKAAKGHYNPATMDHAGPDGVTRHVGDLGNIESDGGKVKVNVRDKIALLKGDRGIIGRTLVIHEDEDDLGKGSGSKEAESKKTGNAGKRIACCVIEEKRDAGGKKKKEDKGKKEKKPR